MSPCIYLAGVAVAITLPRAGVDGWLFSPRPTDTRWGVFPCAGVDGTGTRGEPGTRGELRTRGELTEEFWKMKKKLNTFLITVIKHIIHGHVGVDLKVLLWCVRSSHWGYI